MEGISEIYVTKSGEIGILNDDTLKAIWRKRRFSSSWQDLLDYSIYAENKDYIYKLKDYLEGVLKDVERSDRDIIEAYRVIEGVYKELAPYDLDSFILYMEWGRKDESKFYMPRRKVLRKAVREIQRLIDGELDILTISMPPGVGKSTLELFTLVWVAGKYPDFPSLMFSHSGEVVSGAYRECLRLMQDEEYRYKDVFEAPIVSTNAKNLRIDLNTSKRFETLEFTSIGSQNAGSFRAMKLLCCDDLVDGYETAMSIDRLNKLWGEYTVDARQRKQGNECRELHIATRWSMHDPIGRLQVIYDKDERAEFLVIPALDENEESNFDYPYNLGFSTETYLEQRDIMDEVSWKCLYMNEPIEREGQLYEEEELMRYLSLPSVEPDAIIGICDTKDKGDDYAFLPVMFQYGDYYYLEDCVFDNGKPETIDVRLVEIIERYRMHAVRFESNAAGGRIAENVDKELKKRGVKCQITTKFTTANKETKIVSNSAWVKQHIFFKDKSLFKPNSDYGKMMRNLCSYSMLTKNKHDDAPDGLSMFSEFVQGGSGASAMIIKRPF